MEENTNIDVANLAVAEELASKDNLHVKVTEDVLIIVTQAFGPKGDSLVGVTDAAFDSYPAVTVGVRAEGKEGLVHLSPFHGDQRKSGFTTIKPGVRCELFCPVSKEPLDFMGRLSDAPDAPGFYAVYLTDELSKGEMVLLTDVWDDFRSRIIDHHELLSEWGVPDSELA